MGENQHSRKSSRTITSAHEEKELGNALRKQGYKYFLLYSLLIDTGLSIQTSLSLLVSDVKGRDSLYVKASNSKTEKTLFPMSKSLINAFEPFLENKPLDSHVFCGRDNVTPLIPAVFSSKLADCAKSCGMEYITPFSLKKTYWYHRYLEIGDVNVIRKALKLPSNKAVYEYFGISSHSQKNNDTKENHAFLQSTLFSPDYLLSIQKLSTDTNLRIESCLQNTNMSYISCQTLYNHLEKYINDMKELNTILSGLKQ